MRGTRYGGTYDFGDDDDWCEVNEDEVDFLMNDYVDAVTEDLEEPDDEMIAATEIFANGVRSFAEARDIVRRMRTSRGYYPQARQPGFPNDGGKKGKGKYRGKGKNGKGPHQNFYKGWQSESDADKFWKPFGERKGKGKGYKSKGYSPGGYTPSKGKGKSKSKRDDGGAQPMDIGGSGSGIQPQWIRGGPNGAEGGVRVPMKCPLCGGQHRTRDCPKRGGRDERAWATTDWQQHSWYGASVWMFFEGADEKGYTIMFAYDFCRGKLIANSAATRTVAGLRMLED